jgi:hypothetical protein
VSLPRSNMPTNGTAGTFSRASELSSVIYFSDASPEELSNALAAFPIATKVGQPLALEK